MCSWRKTCVGQRPQITILWSLSSYCAASCRSARMPSPSSSVRHGACSSWLFRSEDLRRAEAADNDTLVAIKLLRRELSERQDALAILQREARRMQQLAH